MEALAKEHLKESVGDAPQLKQARACRDLASTLRVFGFNLGQLSTKGEVKKAFRQALLMIYPDKTGKKSLAEKVLAEACKIISARAN